MPLVPFGSGRTVLPGPQRTITTSCWNAPGLNHKPPAAFSEAADCSRLMLAFMCRSMCQPHSQTNSVPFRESCILPHTGHFLLLYRGSTLTTGDALPSCLVFDDLMQSSSRPHANPPIELLIFAELDPRQVLEDYHRPALLGE